MALDPTQQRSALVRDMGADREPLLDSKLTLMTCQDVRSLALMSICLVCFSLSPGNRGARMIIPMPMPVESPDLKVRVQQLESALALALGLLQTLLGRLELKMGDGFLGEELERLVAPGGINAHE